MFAARNMMFARVGGLFDLKALAYYLFDAGDASKITDTGGSPNLITNWENSASGASALVITADQATTADQPQWDGTKLTFADTSDHLDFSASVTTPGWVVVGTSKGTFAYKTNTTAWAELALLGRSITAYRTLGDLYGIILLPADASAGLIAAARSEMITKGAADGLVGATMIDYFRLRTDMVEFGVIDTSSVTNFQFTWRACSSLTSLPLLDTSAGTSFFFAWFGCSSLTSFPLLDTSAGTSFRGAWYNCSSLTSFPLLDTSAGTNFLEAWRTCTSLTSFPLINTAAGTNFSNTWRACNSLTSFPLINTAAGTNFSNAWNGCTSLTDFPLINTAAGANFSFAWRDCDSLTSFPLLDTAAGANFSFAWRDCDSLTSFPLLDTSAGTNFASAWMGCNSLESFPLLNTTKGTNFSFAWRNCSSLTDFPANFFDAWNPASISSAVFNQTWDGCNAFTPASVENILTSLDTSGKYGRNTGLVSGTILADNTIDIDYNGSGLTAATSTAIANLKAKDWQITINGVLQ